MKNVMGILLLVVILSTAVYAEGLSLQLKRTNPGIAGQKNAEIIFDVVNTDLTHKIEGFIWCKSPDDAVISSTMGAGTGSGAQYVSPKFFMDEGPSQKSLSLTIDSDTEGDKRTGCMLKYIPYKETEEQIEQIEDYNGTELRKIVTVVDKKYQKMNAKYVDEPEDTFYRELRLDKTVPFVKGISNPECPEGDTECKVEDIKVKKSDLSLILLGGGIVVIVFLLLILVFRRRS